MGFMSVRTSPPLEKFPPAPFSLLKAWPRPADLWSVGGTLLDGDRGGLASAPARRRPVQELSGRELEILELVADGLANRQIARQLHVSEETVKTHLRRLMRKLGATSRAHAVAVGIRAQLIR
jgi:DNA-binding CsgD family transcriptional regulator